MQFPIPQFIDIPDKIFGPLTFKQFIYVVGGAGWAFVVWRIVSIKFFALLLIMPVTGLAFLLAFKPVHGRPFSIIMEAAIKYLFGGKLYLWKKDENAEEKQAIQLQNTEPTLDEYAIPRIADGKLDDISWNLDVQGKSK